jgi:hypothetical protein
MNKKVILISAGLGVAAFVGAFTTGWFTTPKASVAATAPGQTRTPAQTAGAPQMLTPSLNTAENENPLTMTREQLQELIGEVRETIR